MATISAVLYKSKTLKDGTHPVYLRLTDHSIPYFLPIYRRDDRFRAIPDQWNSNRNRFISQIKINPNHKTLNKTIDTREFKLRQILEEFTNQEKPWTIDMIRTRFYNEFDKTDVYGFMDKKIKKCKEGEKKNYTHVKNDLLRFTNRKKLAFFEIDCDFVSNLIQFHRDHNRNNTTIGIRLRYLRTILNLAIKAGVGSKETYPFSDKYGATRTISIAQFQNEERKIAIEKDVIEKIKNVSFDDPKMEAHRRFFIASYAARGMNYRDMAKLKYKNLHCVGNDNYINYNRGKTNAKLNFKVSPLLQQQFMWFKERCDLHQDHVFPIFTNKKVENEEKFFQNELLKYNRGLKKIAKALGLDENALTSYVARHSFATRLYYEGVSDNIIGEALAHKSTATTKAYLKQFKEDHLSDIIETVIG